MAADDLRPDVLEKMLPPRIGPLRYFDEIGSTNDEALAWARAGAPHGAFVVADTQSAGRGRHGRSWHATPGSALLFSVVVRDDLEGVPLGLVPLAAGVAVADAVASVCGLQPTLKWPNDVEIDERKICGILCESIMSAEVAQAVVVGIGINVRPSSGLPAELAARATSLKEECMRLGGGEPGRPEVLVAVLESLDRTLRALARKPDAIVDAARTRSSLIGREVVVDVGGDRTVVGRAVSLSADGGLEIQSDGQITVVRSGDVERIRRDSSGI